MHRLPRRLCEAGRTNAANKQQRITRLQPFRGAEVTLTLWHKDVIKLFAAGVLPRLLWKVEPALGLALIWWTSVGGTYQHDCSMPTKALLVISGLSLCCKASPNFLSLLAGIVEAKLWAPQYGIIGCVLKNLIKVPCQAAGTEYILFSRRVSQAREQSTSSELWFSRKHLWCLESAILVEVSFVAWAGNCAWDLDWRDDMIPNVVSTHFIWCNHVSGLLHWHP